MGLRQPLLQEALEAVEEVLPQLLRDLENQDSAIRRCACRTLGALRARAALRQLRAAQEDLSPRVRSAATEALLQVSPEPEPQPEVPEPPPEPPEPQPELPKPQLPRLPQLALQPQLPLQPQPQAKPEVAGPKSPKATTTFHSICTPEGSRQNSAIWKDVSSRRCSSIYMDEEMPEARRVEHAQPARPRRRRRPICPCRESCRCKGCGACGLQVEHVHCFRVCCARLTCSWCLKSFLLLSVVTYIFVSGPLSQPLWIPISTKLACEKNDDGATSAMAHWKNLSSLHACETLCNERSSCQAVDWYNETRWCNLYTLPCLKPTADWDGASSYQKAVTCKLSNGTAGVLIGGHCHVGIQVPSMSSVMEMELPAMLSSWKSWSMTILVTLIYTYMVSDWCRQKLRPAVKVLSWPILAPIRWTYQGGLLRKVGMLILLTAGWAAATYHYWGVPHHLKDVEKGEMPPLPWNEWAWLAGSALLLLLLICKGFRMCILSSIVALGSFIMSVFTTACTAAASLCFESSLLADAALVTGGAAAVEGTAGAAAVAEAGVAAEGAAAADAAMGVEGAAAADVAAGGTAAGEAAAAAEAAAATEAAVAADAALAVEGVAILGLCNIQ